jgi:hypothetical protein
MRKRKVAIGLGWFGIGLGLTEVFAGKALARALGLEDRTRVLRLFGLREIATGIGILTAAKPRPWLWARVAGDALDLIVLGSALGARNAKRGQLAFATASVLGVTALDVVAGATHP